MEKKQSEYELRKISEGVFDKSTLMALYKLFRRGCLDELKGIVSTGKESRVYHGLWGDKEVAVKIYSIEASDFKTMEKYIRGDHRFPRWRNRRQLIYIWAHKEFQNLARVYGKIKCPEPIAVEKNILVMSFIGEEGVSAPRMKDHPPDDLEECLKKILGYIREIYKLDLVHCDLSEYNVLNWGQPYLIDFSMGVLLDHPLAEELLHRDVRNILTYFRKLGIEKNEGKVLDFVTAG
ncbi:MAG: serine protein kinase RIO [Candidatus Altiarchaeota archaeon]|nr:serine protein kinase RIO [Candidatus Altiarchaeota archaeon]